MPSAQVIDSAKLRGIVSAFTGRLAQDDYEGFCRLAKASRIGAAEVERVVRDYGRHFVTLPIEAFQAVDIVPVLKSNPPRWSVVVPLWSEEEGRSDLSLELTVEDSPGSAYSVEIDDLHVQ